MLYRRPSQEHITPLEHIPDSGAPPSEDMSAALAVRCRAAGRPAACGRLDTAHSPQQRTSRWATTCRWSSGRSSQRRSEPSAGHPVLDRVRALVPPAEALCVGRVPSVNLEAPTPVTASVRCLPIPVSRLVAAEERAVALRAQADHRLDDEPRLFRRVPEDGVLVRHEWAELSHPGQLLNGIEDVVVRAIRAAKRALVDVLELPDRRHLVDAGCGPHL